MYQQGLTVIIKKGKHESIVDCIPLRIASELLSLNFYPVNRPRLLLTYFKILLHLMIKYYSKSMTISLWNFTEIHQQPAFRCFQASSQDGSVYVWRAIDTAADPQKDGRDDAKEHLIEGAHKRAPSTGLQMYRNTGKSSFKGLHQWEF